MKILVRFIAAAYFAKLRRHKCLKELFLSSSVVVVVKRRSAFSVGKNAPFGGRFFLSGTALIVVDNCSKNGIVTAGTISKIFL